MGQNTNHWSPNFCKVRGKRCCVYGWTLFFRRLSTQDRELLQRFVLLWSRRQQMDQYTSQCQHSLRCPEPKNGPYSCVVWGEHLCVWWLWWKVAIQRPIQVQTARGQTQLEADWRWGHRSTQSIWPRCRRGQKFNVRDRRLERAWYDGWHLPVQLHFETLVWHSQNQRSQAHTKVPAQRCQLQKPDHNFRGRGYQ